MADSFAGGIKAGSFNVRLPVFLRKSSDATEMAGVAAGSVSATIERPFSAAAPFSLHALGGPTSPYSQGGWCAMDVGGGYWIDIPDSACAAGADYFLLVLEVAGAFKFVQMFALESVGAAELAPAVARIPSNPAAIGSIMKVDMGQMMPTTAADGTVASALLGAWAAGQGDWQFGVDGVGPYWSVVLWDGSTELVTFDQDSVEAPTYRRRR